MRNITINGYTVTCHPVTGEWQAFHPDWYGGQSPCFGSPSVTRVLRWVREEG